MPRGEWDHDKAGANLRRHGVSFDEAATVGDDPLAITIRDEQHSAAEERVMTIGTSLDGTLLVVTSVNRGGKIRIISARRATKRERHAYERSWFE